MRESWRKPPTLLVSEWADQNRVLSSEASSAPGKWNTDVFPPQRAMMDSYNIPEIEVIVVMSCAQIGKSEIILNILGYIIDQKPGPVLQMQPILEMAEAFSKDRIAPMIRDTKCLSSKVSESRTRDSGNTVKQKQFKGGHITLCGSNSPSSIASRPIRDYLADEIDRYPPSAGTEGDPLSLGDKRTTTFWNKKKIRTSTPTEKGNSRIEDEYENSNKQRYYVPCPECGELQTLKWANLIFEKDDPTVKPTYACEHCGFVIEEKHKNKMVKKGKWIAEKPEVTKIAGFHINELYSPWRSWAEIVEDWRKALGKPLLMRTWTNTVLGETFEQQGEKVEWETVRDRKEEFKNQVAEEVRFITCAVDVQKNYLEYEVKGWGGVDNKEESWSITTGKIQGDTSKDDVWLELDEFLENKYEHPSGVKLRINCTLVDSSYRTSYVYDFVEGKQGRRIYAIKGQEGVAIPIYREAAKPKNKDVRLFILGVDDIKGTIADRLQQIDIGPGYIHFPDTYEDEWFKQLCAEKRVTKLTRGYETKKWVKDRKRNEAFDLQVYNYAAVHILEPKYESLERSFEKRIEKVKNKDVVPVEIDKEAIKPEKQRDLRSLRDDLRKHKQNTKQNFVNNW